MDPTVSEDDVGKRVENHDGDQIGIAASVDDDAVYVEPNPGVVDSIKAALGWESDDSDVVPVNRGVIGEVTSDAIRLDSELAVQGGTVGTASGRPPETGTERTNAGEGTDAATSTATDAGVDADQTGADRSEGSSTPAPADPDLAVDPSELTDRDPESDRRPDEDVEDRTGSVAEPERDASLDSAAEPRRSDDAVTSGGGGSAGGPTTEDAGVESGDVDPIADAEGRPTELDDGRTSAGERDDIGEIDEPAGETRSLSDPDEPRDLPDDAADIDDMAEATDRDEAASREEGDENSDATTDRSA